MVPMKSDVGWAPLARSLPDFLKTCAETLEGVHGRIKDDDAAASVGGTILALRMRADLLERDGV